MRGRNIGQRIDRPHMRPQPALRHQCAQLIELAAILPGEHEVIGRVLAPGLDQVLRLRDVHDRHHAAQLRQRVGTARQGIAANGIEHDIHAPAIRGPQYGVDIVLLFIVDQHVRAHLAREGEVRFAHGREHPGADGLGKLDRHVADPAGAAVDQDALPHPQPRARDQRLPGRPAHQAQAGRLQMTQRGGLPADDALGGHVVLGVAALPLEDLRRVPDLISRRVGRHPSPDSLDHARDIVAGDGRQGHQIGIVAAPDLVIQRIDRRGMHPHQHLPRLRHGLGHVAQFERLGAAE